MRVLTTYDEYMNPKDQYLSDDVIVLTIPVLRSVINNRIKDNPTTDDIIEELRNEAV